MKAPPTSSKIATAATIHFAFGCSRKYPMAPRRSCVSRRSLLVRRSPSRTSSPRGSFISSSSSSYCGDIFTGSATLFPSQKCSCPLLCFTQRAHQCALSYVVLVQRLNIGIVRARYRFLRLHCLKTSGDASFIAVLRFSELLRGKINLLFGNRHLIVRGLYVKQGRADFKLHAAAQVFQLQTVLPDQNFRLADVCFDLAALEDRYAHTGGNVVYGFRASGRRPQKACLPIQLHGRQRFTFGGLHAKFGCAQARLRRQIFRTLFKSARQCLVKVH